MTVNVVKRMPRECFDEVAPIFRDVREFKMDSAFGKVKIQALLEKHGVPRAEGLALFLAEVANGIAWEEVQKYDETTRLKDRTWVECMNGMYVTGEMFDETLRSMH